MELRVQIAGKSYQVDVTGPRHLAIPLQFDGPQPRFFGAPAAHAEPFRGGGFTGDTSQGSSCNVSAIALVPHCNGTHTETAAHVVRDGPTVSQTLAQGLMPAVVISVDPIPAGETAEAYRPALEPCDAVITRTALTATLSEYDAEELTALVVRTLPNGPYKRTAVYGEDQTPPFFTADAMTYLAERDVQHLVVDIPSIDRMRDEGRLTNHRIFWNLPERHHEATEDMRRDRTVTEMAFVDDGIADGLYLLDLQIPAFESDAAPSRPVLYNLI